MHLSNVMRRGAVVVLAAGLVLGCGDDDDGEGNGDGGDDSGAPTDDQTAQVQELMEDRGVPEEDAACAAEAMGEDMSADEIEVLLGIDPDSEPNDEEAEVFTKAVDVTLENCGFNPLATGATTTTTAGDDTTTTGDDTTTTSGS